MRQIFFGVVLSVAVFACHKRVVDSVPDSVDTITIHVERSGVAQPVLFASVTSAGECRGGIPKYSVPKADSDWKQGRPLPDLKVDLSVKRVCIAGQAGAAVGGGQDIKYWDMPANVKAGSTLIIDGDKIYESEENDDQNNARNAVLTCESYGAKMVIEQLGDKYVANLTGKAAEMMRDEQGKSVLASGGGYNAGRTFETKKEFPKHWALSNNFDKTSESPKVVVNSLSKSLSGYATDQYGPAVTKEDAGYKIVLTFFELTGSHTSVTYEYANWFFAAKDCK